MSAPATDFLTSASYFRAMRGALEKLGQLEDVLVHVPLDARPGLLRPDERAWWPSPVSLGLTHGIVEVGGPALLCEVARRVVFDAMLGIVRPLAQTVFALGEVSPASIFRRYGSFTASSALGVQPRWVQQGLADGEVHVHYAVPVPPVYEQYWYGGFELAWQMTHRAGEVAALTHDPTVLRFKVRWR